MNRRQRDYTWYVQPLNAHTNLSVSMHLPEENFNQEKQGIPNLWECTEEQARAFWKSRDDSGLDLNIYNQEGAREVRKCNFLFQKTKKKSKLKTAG